MELTEEQYYKALDDIYQQGRFDEYADRTGRKQAKAVRDRLNRQKNCPYCHPGSDLKANFGVAWEGNALAFDNVDSPQVMSGGPYSGDITFDLDTNQLISYGESTDPTTIDILYCPMCGRPLGGN